MRNKLLLLIVGIFVIMWLNDGLQRFHIFTPRTENMQKLDWRNADLRPYQRAGIENDPEETQDRRRSTMRLSKVAGMINGERGVKKANPVVAKANTKDKKKKKKKKKKTAEKGRLNDPMVLRPPTQNNQRNAVANTYDPYVGTTGSAPAMPEPQNDEEKSFEEWRNALLGGEPNVEAVNRFIRGFQSNLVTANVFYAILDEMMKKDDVRFRELAVRAAGSVTTMQSYNFLLAVLENEPAGSSAGSAADRELFEYESPSALYVLLSVIMTGTSDTRGLLYAVQSLDRSTSRYLTNPNQNPNSPRATQTTIFRGFITPLENLLTQVTDTAITEPARRALQRIQAFSGNVVAGN